LVMRTERKSSQRFKQQPTVGMQPFIKYALLLGIVHQ
jgi:hypothetical protein